MHGLVQKSMRKKKVQSLMHSHMYPLVCPDTKESSANLQKISPSAWPTLTRPNQLQNKIRYKNKIRYDLKKKPHFKRGHINKSIQISK